MDRRRRRPSAINPSGYASRIVNRPIDPAQTRIQRKQTGRKKSTAAVKGVGGQNRSVAVGKRAAPTTPSTTRKALTRGQSRRRERVAENIVAQQQRAAQLAQRRAANQAKRATRKAANQAKRTTRMARRTR